MDLQGLEARLKKLLMDRCGARAEVIRPDANLREDLGLDSLDAVELAIAIEDEFDVKILDNDIKKLATVADAVALVRSLLVADAGGPPAVLHPTGS